MNRLGGRWPRTVRGMPSATAAGPPSRLQEFLGSVPLVTLCTMALCIVVYVWGNISDFTANTHAFSISAYAVVYRLELYRIVTAAFEHGGLMHIAMNMMSLYSLGSSLEPLFGSLQVGASDEKCGTGKQQTIRA